MKMLYFECHMGAAGDMLMAALLELHNNPDDFLRRLNNIGIPNVVVTAESFIKCSINGTHITVKVNGQEEDEYHHEDAHEHHNSLHHISHLINHLNISDTVKENANSVYRIIAEAESHAHGIPVNQIHFHEVGEMDAIADIVGVCMLMEELAPDLILASPIHVGSGHVHCAHGTLPVPAPATAYILKDIPVYSDGTKGELCTPTGAALLKHFVKRFDNMPIISVTKLGYGMGKKDFEKVNCIRSYIGETHGEHRNNEVSEIVCNLDDMTSESIAYAQQLLLDEGALDVYVTPIIMKKNRAGFIFTCMCRTSEKDKMLSLIFKHTTTLGIREYQCKRYTLQKEYSELETKFGPIRMKTSHGFGVTKSKPEYEDIAKIAKENEISLQEVLKHL